MPAPLKGTSAISTWLLVAALIAAVFLAYQPVWRAGFIWDDDLHLLNNPVLKPGGLLRAWAPGSYINYWPLTFTVYRLEFELWKLDPLGFHFVNLALHAAAALLVWRVLVELEVPGALAAATIFALHPVNVESVAWIAQLKGLLALALGLAATLWHLQYDRGGDRRRYAAAIAAFALSTLAKGVVVTLPLVLLACAWWRRGTIARRDLLRLLPYLLIGALMAGVEIWAQQRVRADELVRADSLAGRIATAGCAVWFYLGKLAWPFDLCFVYPRWNIDPGRLVSYLPALLLAALLVLAWRRRQTWGRAVVMLIVCYVGLLLPVLGLVNIYFMRFSLVADHWQYAAAIVPCAAAAGAAATWARRRPGRRPATVAVCLALLAALAGLTWRQSRMYADVETLYRTTIEQNPQCWLAYGNLGFVLAGRGQIDEAIDNYRTALRINPEYAEAHNNLGFALLARGKVKEAIDHCQQAVAILPELAEAHNNLGLALEQDGKAEEAIAHYREALRIKPDFAAAHTNLGVVLEGRGEVEEAIAHYRKALESKPDYPDALNNLGACLAGRGQLDEAIACLRRALEVQPDAAGTHNNLGLALARRGDAAEALAHFYRALDLVSAQNDHARAEILRARIRQIESGTGQGGRN